MTPERTRRLRFALISILVVAALVGTVLALRSMIPVEQATTEPSLQTQAEDPSNSKALQPSTTPTETPSTEGKTAPVILQPESGRLAFEAEGKKLGEETYQLERLPTGEYQLRSQGFFSFDVLASKVKFEYTQDIRVDPNLRPLGYSLDFQGPLGLGNRSTTVQIQAEKALISSGEKQREITVPQGRFVLLGMFSSYALATKLVTSGDRVRLAAFIAAGFDGPESQPQEIQPLLFPLEVVRVPLLRLKDRATGNEVEVEQYLLRLGGRDGEDPSRDDAEGPRLLAVKGEFWGLMSTLQDASKGTFRVYRIDLFPQGFDIVPSK